MWTGCCWVYRDPLKRSNLWRLHLGGPVWHRMTGRYVSSVFFLESVAWPVVVDRNATPL